jgi:predicted HTH transcriptional regulator
VSAPLDPQESPLPDASLDTVYRRLFATDGSKTEFPQYERKDYFLSAEMISIHGKVLIETIAGIANVGRATGFIMCRGKLDIQNGSSDPPVIEDSERLDQLMRAAVYPPVHFTVDRVTIEGAMVDVVFIPKSNQRPHFMKDLSGAHRFFVPIRGAANNTTAARHQVDQMYQELTIETLRRAFPGIRVDTDDRDLTIGYAAEIGYGLDPE